MPYINLIQEQRLAVKRDERKAKFFLGALGVIVLISGTTFVGLTMEASAKDQETRSLEEEIKRNKPLIEQIAANDKLFQADNPKVSTLQSAQDVSDRWERILDHVAHQTPPHTWLTAIRCTGSDPEKPISVEFTGMSTSQEPVGEYIMRLQNSTDLEDIGLRFTQEKLMGMSKGIEFQVSGDIAGSLEKKHVIMKETQS
jgi:Tfp pilus assembly protein PilN